MAGIGPSSERRFYQDSTSRAERRDIIQDNKRKCPAHGGAEFQYSSTNIIVKTRVVFDGSLGSSDPNRISASYVSIFQKNFRPASEKLPKSCSRCGSFSSLNSENVATRWITMALTSGGMALTPAVSKPFPPFSVVRTASLSARIFSVLIAAPSLTVARAFL